MSAPYFLMIVRGLDAVAGALRHGLALAVEQEAVREHGLVRGPSLQRGAGEQRRVEPAAVLVGALQVEVDREAQPLLLRHRRPGDAGVPPDVEDVLLAAELGLAALRAGLALGELGPGRAGTRPRPPPPRRPAPPAPSPSARGAAPRRPGSRRPGWGRPRSAGGRGTSRAGARSCCGCGRGPSAGSSCTFSISSSAAWRRSRCSSDRNHWSVARKTTGLWQRQQCG